MPRPKRTKVAPSAPRARPAKSQPEASPQPPKAPFDDLYDVSDADERAATKAQSVKKPTRGRSTRKANATPMRDQTPDNMRKDAEPILDSENVDAMLAEHIQDSSSPAIETGRKVRATPGVESSVLAIGKFKRRPRQQSILGRGNARDRSSSVASDLADDSDLQSVGRKDMSKFSGGNLRKKGRELSVGPAPSSMALQMGTPARVGSAMKIADFKRRAREPSILGTAQKAQSQQHQYEDEDEEEEEEEDDFNPDDESTPLNLSRTRNLASSSNPSSANSRKRKLSGVQVPQSSPRLPSPKPASAETVVPSTETRLEEDGDQPKVDEEVDSDELPHPSIEARPHTPEVLSDTMAPPQSSSSLPPSPRRPFTKRAPSRGRRTQRNQTPPPFNQDSPISSPPSLTHSPNRPVHFVAVAKPQPKAKKAAPPPSTLSTAQLQALLPRRRRRAARDTFDIPSSDAEEIDITGLSPEADELSHIVVRPRSRRGNRASRIAPTKAKAAPKHASKTTATAKSKRTYGSRANPASDEENGAEEDDSLAPLGEDGDGVGVESEENSQELEKRIGKELKRAARKFQEVDQWELDFEEVTASSESARERDAR